MSAPDLYDDRSYDDNGEPLCSLPPPPLPLFIERAKVPSFDFSRVAVDICRTAAASHLSSEYARTISP